MRRPSPQILRAAFLVFAVLWFGYSFLGLHTHSPAHTTKSADLSQLIARVQTNPRSVSRVVFNPGSLQVSATLASGNVLQANYPSDQSALALQTLLERQKVDFAAKAPSHGSVVTSIVVSLLPILLLAAIWIFVMRRMRGGAGGLGQIMSFGKPKATRLAPDLPKVGFKDVAGVDEAVEELQEIKEFLADPRRFQALGARIPKGVLLYGPPGTGKTLLARAVAGEAGVPFFSISGSDFVEMFVGVGASRVRDLFKEAKEAAPCIVFVDELDAVGRHRGAGIGGGNDEREQTLNQLLVEMDGFTGAELANLINEAALLAARRGRTTIGQAELEEGVMRVIAGPEKKTRVFSELERKITASHEMGHALVGHFLEHTDPVHKISIVSRGQALGLTVSLPTEDRFLTSRSALMDQLAMILGGRAAEELVFSEITTGAANDLERATAMSRQMITRFGMSEKLGPRVFGTDPHQPFLGRELGSEPSYSEEMAQEIDEEIYRLIDDAHQRAAQVLLEHQQALHEIAAILIEHETIDKAQFERLLGGEPEQNVLAHEPPPAQPARKPQRKRARKPQPSRAPTGKPVPGAAVARAVRRDDL
jgi:cell division protease FtsH